MSQLPTDIRSGDIAWSDKVLPGGQWHTLNQLCLHLAPQAHQLTLSYCYGEPDARGRIHFGRLTEIRYPVSVDIATHQRLSPRPVVARPAQPIYLAAATSVRLYVGTSLWLSLQRDDDVLLDIPVARLSDTWFGPDTMHGEICYACQTHARLSLAGIPANPYKAMTPITIINEATGPLVLDRINLPVHHLSLYSQNSGDGNQRYWTSAITLTNVQKSPDVEIKVSAGAPTEYANATLLSTGRNPLETGRLRKTLTYLLG
jgi:hypothetical protein